MQFRWLVVSSLVTVILAPDVVSAQVGLPLSVRTTDERVPPGGVLQIKLEVTEPKPISTGSGLFDVGSFDDLLGVAVHSVNDDAAAVVVAQRGGLAVRVLSPSATLGLEPDYPLLTVTTRVRGDAAIGTTQRLGLRGSVFLDAGGAPYPFEYRAGEITVAAVPTVSAVSPGGGTVPAGSIVTISGAGFTAGTEVRFKEAAIATVRVVSQTEIQVVTAQAVRMDGLEIEVRRGNDRLSYFSYPRPTASGASAVALFAAAEPAFPARRWSDAVVRFDGSAAVLPGLALQNIDSPASTVLVQLLDPSGGVRQQNAVPLPAGTRVVRALSDLFGGDCRPGCVVRLQATTPVQVLGLAGDSAAGAIAPLLPSAAAASASASVATDRTVYRPGDVMSLSATFDAGGAPADAYLVVALPDGRFQSLTPAGLVGGLVPYVSALATSQQPRLALAIPADTPAGRYSWLAALTRPGTLSLLTAVSQQAFVIQP